MGFPPPPPPLRALVLVVIMGAKFITLRKSWPPEMRLYVSHLYVCQECLLSFMNAICVTILQEAVARLQDEAVLSSGHSVTLATASNTSALATQVSKPLTECTGTPRNAAKPQSKSLKSQLDFIAGSMKTKRKR